MARIVVLSDIHLSPTHGFFWENWCVAREFADAAKADAVIVNGDLAINGPDSDAEIAFAATALGNLRTRVMALPGNHDVGDEPPGQDPDQIINADRLARWDSSFATDRWVLDAGDWRLVGVNAQLFGSGLTREQSQDQWLDEQLSAAGPPTALFLHKQVFLEGPTDDVLSPSCMVPSARARLLRPTSHRVAWRIGPRAAACTHKTRDVRKRPISAFGSKAENIRSHRVFRHPSRTLAEPNSIASCVGFNPYLSRRFSR